MSVGFRFALPITVNLVFSTRARCQNHGLSQITQGTRITDLGVSGGISYDKRPYVLPIIRGSEKAECQSYKKHMETPKLKNLRSSV